MSLKSFDDFCAKMVNNEPLSQKEIFDERQKITRQKISLQAVVLFATLCVVNTLIMDFGLKWSEAFFAPMMWFYLISYVYWLIENARKGSLFGVEGTLYVKRNGILFIFLSVFDGFMLLDEEDFAVLRDGKLSTEFMGLIFFALALVCGVITLILVRRYNKKQQSEEQ